MRMNFAAQQHDAKAEDEPSPRSTVDLNFDDLIERAKECDRHLQQARLSPPPPDASTERSTDMTSATSPSSLDGDAVQHQGCSLAAAVAVALKALTAARTWRMQPGPTKGHVQAEVSKTRARSSSRGEIQCGLASLAVPADAYSVLVE